MPPLGSSKLAGRPAIQAGVRPDLVVDRPVLGGEGASLLQGVEELAVEELVPELAVEALDVGVLPG
jgi:hypothetical protein